ncbi:MAG: DUF86 domain-containing protein [Anaerohalosphaeraceae bacterium]
MFLDDRTRIRHILDAAREAVDFLDKCQRTDLDTDRKLNLAVVRLLEIIGEAAYGVSETTKERYPQIPWHQMTGMRNRLIHGYFEVNADIIWKTVKEDLPALIRQLEQLPCL